MDDDISEAGIFASPVGRPDEAIIAAIKTLNILEHDGLPKKPR
jgi:hypothetical protein